MRAISAPGVRCSQHWIMKLFCLLGGPVRVGFIAVTFYATALHAGTPLDGTFNASLNGSVSSIALQSDGKIIIGGGFTTVNGVAKSYIARLNADGSIDDSFAPTTPPGQPVSRVTVVGSDVYVSAGDGVRRFNSTGAQAWHYAMNVPAFAVDSQQRVIIGGQFSRVDGQPHRNIARLTSSGVIDSTFSTAIGCCAGEGVNALATQGDAIFVGGLFQSINESNIVSHFARIGSDGSLDGTFNGAATPRVLAIVPMADGKVLRVSEQTMAMHLASGADDSSFIPVSAGGSSEDRFATATVDGSGRVVAGGNFTTDGGATRSYVARYNSDGSPDSSFAISPNGQVNTVAVQADGRVLIGGWFTEVNGTAHVGLARVQLEEAGPALNKLHITGGPSGSVVLSWAQGGSHVLETRTLSGGAWTQVSAAPTVANGMNVEPPIGRVRHCSRGRQQRPSPATRERQNT